MSETPYCRSRTNFSTWSTCSDRVIGRAPRRDVHARNLLHRAVHVLVHDDRRAGFSSNAAAWAKDTFPGCWDSSCSGHLDAGEDYSAAARRELGEELGWHDAGLPLRPVVKLPPRPKPARSSSRFSCSDRWPGRSRSTRRKSPKAAGFVPADLDILISACAGPFAGSLAPSLVAASEEILGRDWLAA